MRIDLNADLGEGVGDDEALLAVVTSASIATGAHAGGGAVLRHAVAAAAGCGVAIGAHPSYRDRAGFGRASHLDVLRRDASARSHLVADLVGQILDVAREAQRRGVALAHVKAHGALYNEAVHDPMAAQVVADAVLGAVHALGHPVAVLTQPGGRLADVAARHGLVILAEGFADRGYRRTGRLVARSEPGAVHGDLASMVAQALDLAGGHVDPVDGSRIEVPVDSLCVHGDTPGAVAAARAIRAALAGAGWQVVAPGPGSDGPAHDRDRRRTIPRVAGAEPTAGEPTAGEPTAAEPTAGEVDRDPAVIHPFGDRALLIEPSYGGLARTAWVLRISDRARRRWPGASVVPGLSSVLVAFAEPSDRPDPHRARLGTGAPGPAGGWEPEPPVQVVPTRYDGPDLADVAGMLGLPVVEVVRRHREAAWTVATVGFSPGFGYLTTEDPLFAGVGRRADPRPRVPRGSVALAAGMSAVYPSATPGGWQLIGSTTAALFDVHAERPALLRVGDRVQFLEVP